MRKIIIYFFCFISATGLIFLSLNAREIHSCKNKINDLSDNFSASFKSGDIIFRDGRGAISTIFRRLSLTDPRYSHAGIIHREGGKIFVYHVIGGEGNPQNVMRKDLLGDFLNSSVADCFGVYRMDADENSIDSLAGVNYRNKVRFDPEFDLGTKDVYYCTEMIYHILQKVSGDENYFALSALSGTKYIACDNIYLSRHSKEIYSHNYQR